MWVPGREGRRQGRREEGRNEQREGERKGEVGICAMTMEVRESFGEVSSLLPFSYGFWALHSGQ